MRKFFTSLFLLAACSGQLLYANAGAPAAKAPNFSAKGATAMKPLVDDDLVITSVGVPTSGCDLSNNNTITITLNNLGTLPITGTLVEFNLNHPVNGVFAPYVQDFISDDILPGVPYVYSFSLPVDMSDPGTYTFEFLATYLPDPVTTNNTFTATVTNAGTALTAFNLPYIEDFETSTTWTAYSNATGTNTLSTWALGTPNSPTLNTAASGVNAWVTNLTGNHNSTEQSYVMSPCFDFTGVDPVIMLDVWWNTNSTSGAKLQYTTNNGGTWTDMGQLNDPTNWYNDGSVSGLSWATGASVGWAGSGSVSSNGWQTAIRENTGLANMPNVRFRIAFGANGTPQEGFAFDNFRVYSKTDDIKISAVVSPVSGCDLSATSPITIQVQNMGDSPISFWYANVDIETPNNGTFVGYALDPFGQGDILANQTYTHTYDLPFDMSAPGTYTFTFYVNYALDMNNTNDTLVYTVVNAGPSISTFPYVENFEGPSTWAAYSNGTAPATLSTWAVGTPTTPALPGVGNTKAWKTNLNGNYNAEEQSYVLSPCFDFTGVDPIIEFDVWWNSSSAHGAKLQYTLDNGATWTTIGSVGEPNNWYNDATVPGLSWATGTNIGWAGTAGSSSGGWKSAKHEWTGLFDKPSVRFRFAFGANGGTTYQGFAFDNFKITPKPNYDLVAVQLMPFAQGCGLSATEPIQIQIYNNGINPVVGYVANYVITPNNGSAQTASETVNDTIQPFTYYVYTFNQTADLSTGNSFDFTGSVMYGADEDTSNDSFDTSFLNSVHDQPAYITFENGLGDLGAFSTILRPESRILVNSTGAYGGSTNGMIMDGHTQNLGWSDFDALTKPFNTNANPNRFSSAIMCVRTPDSLSTLKLGFYLNQLYHNGNFLWTNFRVTVNGTPIPLERINLSTGNVTPFVPAGNQQAIRPPVTITGSGQTGWERIEADLTPYLNDTIPNLKIAFESSVKFTYNYTSSAGTANLIDSIMVIGSYAPDTTVDCVANPYHPDCPCGPVFYDELVCCPDANNPLCPDTGTFVNEAMEAAMIRVFPNPSQGEFTIDLKDVQADNYMIEVMDVTGKVTRRESIRVSGQTGHTFTLSDQPKGIYFLKISSDTKVFTTKLILQ